MQAFCNLRDRVNSSFNRNEIKLEICEVKGLFIAITCSNWKWFSPVYTFFHPLKVIFFSSLKKKLPKFSPWRVGEMVVEHFHLLLTILIRFQQRWFWLEHFDLDVVFCRWSHNTPSTDTPPSSLPLSLARGVEKVSANHMLGLKSKCPCQRPVVATSTSRRSTMQGRQQTANNKRQTTPLPGTQTNRHVLHSALLALVSCFLLL